MKRVCLIAVCAFAAAGMLSPIRAERPVKLLQCKIGTAWPGELRGSGGVTGVLDFAYGRIVDKKVGFGISGSFLWESTSTDSTVGDRIKKMWNEETYMLPVMGFVELDPIPDRIVHPIARFSIGYNSMIYRTADSAKSPGRPYFFGLIMKLGVDGVYDVGNKSSLFVGIDYQWADMRTVRLNNLSDPRDMSGPGLGAGFRVKL